MPPLPKRVFDEHNLSSPGAGNGIVADVNGSAIDLSSYKGVRRLLVSFALTADSKVDYLKTRSSDTQTTHLKSNDTLTAHNGYGPISIPCSELDTIDIAPQDAVGFDWIIIEVAWTCQE